MKFILEALAASVFFGSVAVPFCALIAALILLAIGASPFLFGLGEAVAIIFGLSLTALFFRHSVKVFAQEAALEAD